MSNVNRMERRAHEDDSPDEALLTAIKQKRALEELTNTPGWAMVKAMHEEQIRERQNYMMTTEVTVENIAANNFARGEMNAHAVSLAFVANKISEADDVIELYQAQARQGSEHDNPDE